MIRSESELALALETALAGLENPPPEHSAEEEALLAVLTAIRNYRSTASPSGDKGGKRRADQLMAEAMALRERTLHRPLSARLSDGFSGIGNSVTGEPRHH